MTTLRLFDDVDPHPLPKRGSRAAPRGVADLSPVEQFRRATHPRNRLALAIGCVFGAFVPAATFTEVHLEVAARPHLWVLVAGGLVFSALSVFQVGRSAFGSVAKSLGFVVLIEGTMVFSGVLPLALTALVLLCVVNAISAGTSVALGHRPPRRARTGTLS